MTRAYPIPQKFNSTWVQFYEHPDLQHLPGKTVILLGNSPAVTHPKVLPWMEAAKEAGIVTVGVNRILRSFTPDIVGICDAVIVKQDLKWLREYNGHALLWDGLFHLTRPKALDPFFSHVAERTSSYRLQQAEKNAANWYWPREIHDPILRPGITPGYVMQVLALMSVRRIGLVGVDHNARALKAARKDTHFYGHMQRSTGGAGDLVPMHKANRLDRGHMLTNFYRSFPLWACSRGVDCWNLSPYDDSSFTVHGGWHRMSAKTFVETFGA